MSGEKPGASPPIRSVQEFYAFLYAMELEAGERYEALAEQMETHNNRPVAALFRELAAAERKHVEKLRRHGQSVQAVRPRAMGFRAGFEYPETLAFEKLHYLMDPAHALALALESEEQAAQCFEEMAASAPDAEVRALAAEVAKDERGHVERIRAWMATMPAPRRDWAHDPDPPHNTE